MIKLTPITLRLPISKKTKNPNSSLSPSPRKKLTQNNLTIPNKLKSQKNLKKITKLKKKHN